MLKNFVVVCLPLGAKIGCDAFVKDIEGVAANGKTKLQQGRKT